MKYTFKTKPRPHQVRGLRFLLRNKGGGLQVPMRYGKTKVCIDFCGAASMKWGWTRILVTCPLSVVGVWEDEITKHQPDSLKLEWMVVNYEQLYDRHNTGGRSWVAMPSKAIQTFRPHIIIADESHRIGNPGTITSKFLCIYARQAKCRVFITGTMFHRKPFFVFGQFKFYDPSIFGTAFGAFKKQVAVFGGFGGYEILGYRNLTWMMDKIKPHVYIEKYMPTHEAIVTPLYFHLTDRNLAYYSEMLKEAAVRVGTDYLSADNVLVKHLYLQQIAGGWVKIQGIYKRIGDDKYRVAVDRFQTYADNEVLKVVVGCRFIPELYDAAKAAKKAGYRVVSLHGGIKKSDRQQRIKAFNASTVPTVFVAQIAAAREGIDLSSADTMLFYSLSPSFVDHDQFSKRIEVYGEKRSLSYDFLVARGTVDEITFEALQHKKDVADFIVDSPRKVEELSERLSQARKR